jgi:hypothetical protein
MSVSLDESFSALLLPFHRAKRRALPSLVAPMTSGKVRKRNEGSECTKSTEVSRYYPKDP